MNDNLCFTESFIQPEDAEVYFTKCLDSIDLREWEVTEASLFMINEKSVVRIMAKPRQQELVFGE